MSATSEGVRVWAETITIPTYPIGTPDKNPMFLERRVYQGSSGVVYPHPVVERVFDEIQDRDYTAIFLENRYLKIMLLPEIGGRVQMALDKTNGYHFIYYNRTIKPALVGLTGPWISGGIEFNWPQHHRPSTFDPVDWRIETNPDGSMTAWMGEIEQMFRTKGMAGFTLYPDRAYLEIKVQLYNRTSEPQSFLWWMNPAVHVNDDYRSIFPPDVHAVMDHGRRDVSSFPIATSTYYKVDYSPGTDISRYKNIPVPTSYMAERSDFDFLGCYDSGKAAGMMICVNHHVAPGKKQWTWGNGDFGRAWDRQLTDADGPYAELMCGVYTDNQPDFSWIQPGEEKRFTQWVMPFKHIDGAKNANKDAVINLDVVGNQAEIGVYISSPRTVKVQLLSSNAALYERSVELSPETTFVQTVTLPAGLSPQQITLRVLDGARELISFTPLPDAAAEMPDPATPAKRPHEIASSDELFLNGQHLEQYRHATYQPEPYYLEALRRDPLDSRCNNAMGLLLYRRGKFAEAEAYFRSAIKSVTRRNPNPYDCEPFYNLGLALKMQGKRREAFDAFYKAIWDSAYQDSGYFELARLASDAGRYEEAFDLVERSIRRNASHHAARHLKIALLRHLDRAAEAQTEIQTALALDSMNFGALYEKNLLDSDLSYRKLMRGNVHTLSEISLDYAHAGLFTEAIALLSEAAPIDPMVLYLLGWVHAQIDQRDEAARIFAQAALVSPDYCFPNRLETVPALECAMEYAPNDARAPYYLGNFWYGHRRYDEAIACWERSRSLDPNFPTVNRNLGLAYLNKQNDPQKALAAYKQAFRLDPTDARVFAELDGIYKHLNLPPQERLERLEQHLNLVEMRDDLTVERAALLNLLGRPQEALALLLARNFHPWEGGEGKVTGQYSASLIALARRELAAGDYTGALADLERTQSYPSNLGEGKLYSIRENNLHYYLGCACEGLGRADEARKHFTEASFGESEPTLSIFYNDQPPDMIYYQGLALQKLGQPQAAQAIFQKLIDYGSAHMNDIMSIEYFAVSLPDFVASDEDLGDFNRVHCEYLLALGYAGLGNNTQAQTHFDTVLKLNPYHLGATIHRTHMPTT